MNRIFAIVALASVGLLLWFTGRATTDTTELDPYGLTTRFTRTTPHSNPSGRASDQFPDPILIDHEGKEHRFYSDLVKDQRVVIQFFYTSCNGI